MQKSADSIIRLFDKKRHDHFTGGIKLGFEQGRPVNCSEYSNPEQSPPPVPEGFNIQEHITRACANGYYGSLLFILDDGKVTHFSYVRTWAGKGIDDLLVAQSANVPPMR
jgi:hypothetical protein